MAIVALTNFTGYYQIATTPLSEDSLQSYIDREQVNVLQCLLGIELYDLFIADLVNNVPQTTRFINIYNAISYQTDYEIVRSQGMVTMLTGFTYYAYASKSDYLNTIAGNIKNKFSNSEHAQAVQYGLYDRYNLSIVSYDAIQQYICDNTDDYPEYNGITKEMITWL